MSSGRHEPGHVEFAVPGAGAAIEEACAAALACLPGMGPATLRAILSDGPPSSAWEAVRAGRVRRAGRPLRPGPDAPALDVGSASAGAPAVEGKRHRPWDQCARALDPAAWWVRAGRGVRVTWWGAPDYPAALLTDPLPPAVLFWQGRLDCLDRPCVAVVGTRSATPEGRTVAFEMGRDLAAAGVCVVSGLALGIDGAAHAGAMTAVLDGAAAGPVGVAASGVDLPYPRRHARLWEQVAASGAILSENRPGRPAQAWMFPARNRIIAGLVRMVVVVESHLRGGSLITAEAAMERGVDVRVVPGPVRSPASEGSNQLLYDGPGPVRDARDVLDSLGLILPATARGGAAGARPDPPDGAGAGDPVTTRVVLEAIGWAAVTTGQIVARSGLDVATVTAALEFLAGAGRVREEGGWWSRR